MAGETALKHYLRKLIGGLSHDEAVSIIRDEIRTNFKTLDDRYVSIIKLLTESQVHTTRTSDT